MKSAVLALLVGVFISLSACDEPQVKPETDLETVKKLLSTKEKKSRTKESKVRNMEGIPLAEFVLEGYSILDTIFGDLNKDAKEDCALILKSKEEEKEKSFEEINRPLLLLLGTKEGKFELAARNDRVVYCKQCGGVFGDPYTGVTIKNGYFSVEHYGGSNWRWTRVITFKYDEKKKKWFLSRDGGDSFHTSEPEKVETQIKTTKDFGVISFEEFNNF
jgi:hypothetical protein